MFARPPRCPDPACEHHNNPAADFYVHRGSCRTRHDRQEVPRYQCKACVRTFSSRRFSPTARQHKPEVNDLLAKMPSSGVTQRRAARLLRINKATVAKKFAWPADQARKAHAAALATGRILTSYVQFDEMETIERTKLKALSIALTSPNLS